ncbi:M20/M25/M40 family metallo-hydrolase [uncultured Brevundimonas sp.]|uniref:M20/M25/M40 family metallo-hydrolase n=1 Tax=uncultured Brevundimonas sp. TaxID=213418 RepID=UPI00262DADF0|nr:M20/M25/M40 family metallo-hydrolase [uncultured Brevundimonas sp.]
MSFLKSTACAAALLLAAPAVSHAQSTDAALDILSRSIAFRTVNGSDIAPNQTPEYAAFLKDRLVAGGFDPASIEIEEMAGTAAFTATWQGTDPALKPIIILAHMDVVEADPKDWERDPFTPVIENGYIFGRGSADNKADLSMVVATIIKLKQEGWQPKRSIVLAFSGDEETAMATTVHLAEKFKHAELVLNADGGGGELDEHDQPIIYGLQAAEKTYFDYTITATDAGGHSSRPTAGNPIYRLSAALQRLNASPFPVRLDEITRGSLKVSAERASPETAAAINALLADETDQAAIDFLSADPNYVGTIRTTCTATMIKGGHAPNALPQQAQATINCRILPGFSMEEIRDQLTAIVADPTLTVAYQDSGTLAAPASPLRDDVVAAVTAAVHSRFPNLDITPAMSAGATDSMHFRARGVPSYGVGSVFMKAEDEFSHGLNERLPIATIAPGITHWETLLKAIAN